MATFTVSGPYEVALEDMGAAKVVDESKLWSGIPSALKAKKGVYVFTIKTSGASRDMPYYIGKAGRSFGQEAFTTDKLKKYNRSLARYHRAYGYIYFVCHPQQKTNHREIKQIEDYFISVGASVNEVIENDKGTKVPPWKIDGVVRDSGGRATNAAKAFREMFRMKK